MFRKNKVIFCDNNSLITISVRGSKEATMSKYLLIFSMRVFFFLRWQAVVVLVLKSPKTDSSKIYKAYKNFYQFYLLLGLGLVYKTT